MQNNAEEEEVLETLEPHQDTPTRRAVTIHEQESQDDQNDSQPNPRFHQDLAELTEVLRRRRTEGTAADPVLISTPQMEPESSNTSSTPAAKKMDLERVAKFKEVFSGDKGQNIEAFFDRFDLWCENNGHTDAYKTKNFVMCLNDPAYSAYKSLDQSVRNNYDLMKQD